MFKSTKVVLCVALVILSVVQVHGNDEQDKFESEKKDPATHLPEPVITKGQQGKSEPEKKDPVSHLPETVTPKAPTPKPTPKAPTPKPTPPHCNPGDRKAVEHSCKHYQECDKTFKWVDRTCSVECKVFEPKSSKCVWNWQYPCMKPPTTVPPPTTTTLPTKPNTASSSTATPSPSTSSTKPSVCINGSKRNVTPKDCKHYFLCQSGQWVRTSCSFGYDFDVDKNDCVWSWWAKC